MVVCFGRSIVRSMYIVVAGLHVPGLQHPSVARFLKASVEEVVLLAVAVYLVHRQGRSLKDLGFGSTRVTPGIRDLFPAAYLAIGSSVASYFVQCWLLIVAWLDGLRLQTHHMNVGFIHVAHSSALVKAVAAAAVVVNPIYEESLVRAYLMTEIIYFTRKPWLALIVSVLVQASYHLYQGVVPAISYLGLFGVFAYFYMRTGRIWPVILAHMILDGIAVFLH